MVPTTFHLAENSDARNLEMATGHPDDPDVVAWIVALNQPVTNPQTWVVRVRWRGDGVIAATPADLETKQLEAAMARPAEKRLASSAGTFKRFVDEPELIGHVVDWVEERTPASGKGPVFDCHAVRLARRGILEFSIIGVSEAVSKTCGATLQAFTEKLTFDGEHEYPDQPGRTEAPRGLLAGPHRISSRTRIPSLRRAHRGGRRNRGEMPRMVNCAAHAIARRMSSCPFRPPSSTSTTRSSTSTPARRGASTFRACRHSFGCR